MNFPFRKSALIIAISMAAVACGGGGGGGGKGKSSEPSQTGVFLDSAVAGIHYRLVDAEGRPKWRDDLTTNEKGEYKYDEGDSVIFYIGALEFPPVRAAGIVTPADIAAGNGTLQTNIIRILQSVDKDGDPSNGIQVEPKGELKDALDQAAGVDLTKPQLAEELSIADELLVSRDDAKAHFAQSLNSLLLGSWVYEEGPGMRNVLTFFSSSPANCTYASFGEADDLCLTGEYIIIHEHDDDEEQRSGSAETAAFIWNATTGAFGILEGWDSDGSGGLLDGEETSVTGLKISDGKLVISIEDEGDVAFSSVSGSNPLVGAWVYSENDGVNILTILSDSEYVIAHTGNHGSSDPKIALSGEFGTYTYNSADGSFTITGVTVDSDEDGGLYNADKPEEANKSLTMVQERGALLLADANEEIPFIRVSSFQVDLRDMDGPQGTAQVNRYYGGFREYDVAGRDFSISYIAEEELWTVYFSFSDASNAVSVWYVGPDEEPEELSGTWSLTPTGEVEVVVVEEDEEITATLIPLNGGKHILYAQKSVEEDSLWIARIKEL